MIAAIAAIDNNWGIGRNGNLIAYIPEDRKFFKAKTNNATVIMGRKTWDSLSNKPLPNRRNIVISRNISKCCEDGTEFTTLENVIPVLENVEESEKIFVIGGGQIYKELLPYCDTLYLTKIFGDFKADTFFPYINEKNGWKATEWSNVEFDGSLPYQFVTYKRKQ